MTTERVCSMRVLKIRLWSCNNLYSLCYCLIHMYSNTAAICSCCSVVKSCLSLCNSMDCSMTGSFLPLSLRVCSNSCPLSPWCYLTISSSANPFSFCLQSFPASGSFPVSWLFTSSGQSIRASTSVLPMIGLISFRIDWLDLPEVRGTFKSLLQHHNPKASISRHSAFLAQLSYPYMITGKNYSFDYMYFCQQSDVSAFLICCLDFS